MSTIILRLPSLKKICVTCIIKKGLINLIYKELLKIKKKKINCPIEKWTKESYGS